MIGFISLVLLLVGLASRALHDPRDDLLAARHLPPPHSAWFSRY